MATASGERDMSMTDERLEALERWREEMEAKFIAAFPSGNHGAHRLYHETQMEILQERRRLVAAVKEKTIAGLVWGVMLAVALACWKYFLSLLPKG